jgi:hypothetical protein
LKLSIVSSAFLSAYHSASTHIPFSSTYAAMLCYRYDSL